VCEQLSQNRHVKWKLTTGPLTPPHHIISTVEQEQEQPPPPPPLLSQCQN